MGFLLCVCLIVVQFSSVNFVDGNMLQCQKVGYIWWTNQNFLLSQVGAKSHTPVGQTAASGRAQWWRDGWVRNRNHSGGGRV